MKKSLYVIVGSLLCLFLVQPLGALADEEIIIGTGSKDSIYYYAGKSICRIVNSKVEGMTCQVVASPDALFNLSNVREGGLDIGVVPSDWQYYAVKGTGPVKFMDGSFDNLRALFSLYAEPFTLVVRGDSGISTIEQIAGRRVNIGNPGSRERKTMEVVMRAMGWSKKDFKLAQELSVAEQSLALCHNKIDAMVYTVGHPNASVSKVTRLCDAKIAAVSGPAIDKLVAENPYYAYTDIPGGMYPGNPDPVRTFGVIATVVTSADVSSETITKLVRAVFEHLGQFRKLHPALRVLNPEEMIRNGLSAELHPGAKKYYVEKGLL